MNEIARTVVHYGAHDPRSHTGGVEAFARNLGLLFEQVVFMTPRSRDVGRVRREGLPVICDNQLVLDWPVDIPVVGFQHGVAAEKARVTRSIGRYMLARRQRLAAARPNTLWVACAEWISKTFEEMHGNAATHVIYHPIDVDRFDGALANETSRLVLHDARLKHKGSQLIPLLAERFADWSFEPLNCPPDEVPARMRKARAFVHLSKYEGNSIVCNEAMAMNLPCMFTGVGLMRDAAGLEEVFVVDARAAFRDHDYLLRKTNDFLTSLATRDYQPRAWVLENATRDVAITKWADVLGSFDVLAA